MTQATAASSNPSAGGLSPLSQLQIYVQLVASAGAIVICGSLMALRTTSHPWEWLLFAALAVMTGSFSMKVASVSASVTVSDTFFITTALLFGPAPATLAVALDTFVVSWRRGHGRVRIAFNTATPALGMWAGSHVFFMLSGIPPLIEQRTPPGQLIVPLLALTTVYFLMNSGLTALAVGLDTRKSPMEIWRKHFLWLSVNCFAAASVSFCLIVLISQVNFGAVVIVLPLLVVLHLTLRSSFGRLEDSRTHLAHLDRLYLSTVETLAMAIDAKDDVTHSHVRRVQAYAVGLAKVLGVSDEPTLKAIEAAALLHDTGKLAVPEHILNKPGKLSPAEFEQMKRHVDVGADILSLVDFPYPVVPIVRCHHESWDGSGYPRGIAGTDIPIGARILSVVDCFDALTSDRPYRSALTNEQAFEILRARSGTMYEPLIVDTFIRVHSQLAIEIVEMPGHRDVLQQISQAIAPVPQPQPLSLSAVGGASDDLLGFVSLARLASGDAAASDILALASKLMTGVAPGVTTAWYVLDTDTNRLVLTDAAGPAAHELSGITLNIGDGVSGWVAAHRQAIVNSEAALDLGSRAGKMRTPLESCLSVPLIAGETLAGVVTLYSEARGAFNDDQSRLVQVIAPHIAQALITVKRHHAAEQPSVRMRAERELKLVNRR